MPPRTSALSAEAAAMELKLAELRKAMEKERAKREALMAGAGGGSIWRNGASAGGMRNNAKVATGATAANSGASTSRRPDSREASGSTSSRGAAAEASPEAPLEMPSVSGSRLNSRPTVGPSSRNTNILDLQSDVGGMCCGPDDDKSLAVGGFSEADSHRSFLDALNEWRKGSRGEADTATDSGGGGGAGVSGGAGINISGGSSGSRAAAAAAVESATFEVQTEQRPLAVAARPSSAAAKPLSFFDKLVINTTSRTAGQLAAGVPADEVRVSISIPARPASAARGAAASASGPALEAGEPVAPAATDTATGSKPVADNSSDKKGAAALEPQPIPAADPSNPLSILDRLEALERQRQAAEDDAEDDGYAGGITVTNATGVMLTKGTRLPDEVLMPSGNEGS